MTTVKQLIEKKSNTIFSVRSSDNVERVLMLMRDHRVRAVLVIDDGVLAGIVSQGDCAIKVLLPHNDPKHVTVSKIMTMNPLTVMLTNSLEECMAIMVHKHIRHLPVVPVGHFKLPHLWPVKLPQAGWVNYQSIVPSRARRAVASLSR